jgi:hypothetical protein
MNNLLKFGRKVENDRRWIAKFSFAGRFLQTSKQFLVFFLTVNEVGFVLVAAAMFFLEFLVIYQIIQRVPCKL